MKKIRTTALMVLSAIVMVAFVGCTKDNENNGGNNGGGNNNGNTYNGHEYVDLGLPSGTLWATCNVGATTPEGYGNYFAWGETVPKENYTWSTYKWCNYDGEYYDVEVGGWMNFDCREFTKYCNDSDYGQNGFCDSLTMLQSTDDAATVHWGNGWRTPTKREWEELLEFTTRVVTFQNNVTGVTFTSANGNSIFMPYTGWKQFEETGQVGRTGRYWASEYCWYDSPQGAFHYDIYEGQKGNRGLSGYTRCFGATVRPVRSAN